MSQGLSHRGAGARAPAAARRRAPRVGFVSLGCPKALVDSERIITQLRAEGYEVAPSYQAADLVVVNTCGFIDAAIDESLEAIGEALEQNGRVIVTGCLGANPQRILARHPRVLEVTGPQAYEQVVGGGARAPAAAARPVHRPGAAAGRAAHAAALRVSEDRGRLQQPLQLLHHPGAARRAREPPHRRGDARGGAAGDGGREGAAGDLAGHQRLRRGHPLCAAPAGAATHYETRFIDLARALGELGRVGAPALRLSLPARRCRCMPLMAERRVLPYLDMPFQHGSPTVLKRMRRPAHAEDTLARIAPGAASARS